MEDGSEDIYAVGTQNRYGARPVELENMCYARFGANYRVDYKMSDEIQDDHIPYEDEENDNTSERIQLQNCYKFVCVSLPA